MTGKYLPILPGFPVPRGNPASCKNTFYRSGKMFHMDLSVALQLNIDPQNKNLLFIELIFMSYTLATPCSSSLTRVRICLILSMPSAEILRKLPSVSRSQYFCHRKDYIEKRCRERRNFAIVHLSIVLLLMDKCRSLLNILVIILPQRAFKNLRPADGDVICQFSNSSGKMIICPTMNINLLFVGGASIFAKFLS